MLREQVKFFFEYFGFRLKDGITGPKTLTVTHYMTLLQQLTSHTMRAFQQVILRYIPKGKKAQKMVKEILNSPAASFIETMTNGFNTTFSANDSNKPLKQAFVEGYTFSS
jgi:hypothetical protein